MSDLSDLAASVAAVLRREPSLAGLAPHWGAEDARGHVFLGAPPVAAANAGRAPYVVVQPEAEEEEPRRQGDGPDAARTSTLALRLVARERVDALARRVEHALAAGANRHLGDAAHVLAVAAERGPVERLGPCESTVVRLRVRRLAEPGAGPPPPADG